VPYWEGTRRGELCVQRCGGCGGWQWGPEWMCHRCLGFDLQWETVAPHGRIYSWERAWHPVHPALRGRGPYIIVLVELPHAGGIRMVAISSAILNKRSRSAQRWRRCSSPTTRRRPCSRWCNGGRRHEHDRAGHQRAQSLAAEHARSRHVAADRAPRRSEEVLHRLGGRARQRARRSVGHAHRCPVSRPGAEGHRGRQRREVAGVRGPPAGSPPRRRARGRGPAAPAGRSRPGAAPARHGSRRDRRRGDVPQQGAVDVGHARRASRHGPVPRLQRLGVGGLRKVQPPHVARGGDSPPPTSRAPSPRYSAWPSSASGR